MEKNKLNKWLVFIIIILIVIIGVLFFKYQDLKYSLIEYKSVPRIALANTLSYSSYADSFNGYVKGFVAFNDINDQPRDAGQYYIIEPLNRVDESGNQIFSLEEIIAFYNLPPYSTGNYELTEINNSYTTLTLDDGYGNQFFINKNSREITMKDKGGDETRLITSDSDYTTFMRYFLRK